MGKTNRAQRTKGNTRPSNSGHSAELLNSSGKPFSGFVGFDALKEVSYVPVTGQHTIDDVDKSVDATFRMIMRRMLKRDPTTRLKAVQEFGEHCSDGNKEVIKNILPFWPRLFNKLALDTDRRIREATHESNGKLIYKVKRDIAPYLKSIMGVWLLGQNDLYAPSASAAQSTFLETFPTSKQSEALMFCKVEVFSYFKDNLFEQTAKSMSDPNPTSEEDVENKYTLVISSTLQAIKFILSALPQDDRNSIKPDLVSILTENKFWKYSKNKAPQIRGAWYSVLGSLCRDLPDVFENLESKLSTSIFSCLSETDPIVAPSIWEAALHTIVSFENCWRSIDVNKVVLPQLWMLLKEGGNGNASVLFPCLLPFLCKLPTDVTEKESFLQQFFSSLKNSLYLERVKVSTTECDAIVTAFMECIEFIIFHRLDFEKDGLNLLEKIMNDQLTNLTESSFTDENSHLATSKLFPLLGSCIQKMEKKYYEKNNKNTSEAFAKALTLFWEKFNVICCSLFSEELERKKSMSTVLAYFFHSMYEPSNFLFTKRKKKVKFEGGAEGDETKTNLHNSVKVILDNQYPLSNRDSLLLQQTLSLCEALCISIEEEDAVSEPYFVKLLSEIILVARSSIFFYELLKKLTDFSGNEKEAPVAFFQHVVLNCLRKSDDTTIFEHLIDIIFSICSCVEKEEALTILNDCSQVKNAVLMKELLSKGLESCQDDNVFKEWLKSPELGQAMTHIVKDALQMFFRSSETSLDVNAVYAHYMTVHIYLVGSSSSETPINSHCINTILNVLSTAQSFCEKNGTWKPALTNFLCDVTIAIMKNYKECWSNASLENLLVLLFRQSLKTQFHLSEDLSKKMIMTWQIAIEESIAIKNELLNESGFICLAAKEIHNLVISFQSAEEFSRVLEHGFGLLSTIEEALNSVDSDQQWRTSYIMSVLLEKILPSKEDWEQLKENLHLNVLPAFMERKIFYPFPGDNEDIPVPPEHIPQYVMVAEVVSDILVKKITHAKSEEDEKIVEEYVTKHLPHLLWSFSYCEGNGYLKREETSEYCRTEKLQKNCFKMLTFLTHKEVLSLVNVLFDLSLSEGLEWALPLQIIIEIIKTIHPEYVSNIFELLDKARKSDSKSKHIIVQVLIHHVSTENKIQHLKTLVDEFLQTEGLETNAKDTFFGILAEVCCCIQDSEVFQSSENQILLTDLIVKIIRPENSSLHYGADGPLFGFQIMSTLSAVTKYAPSMLSTHLWNLIFDILICSLKKSRSVVNQMKSGDLLLLHQTSSLLYVVSLLLGDDGEQQGTSGELPKYLWKTKIYNEVYQDFLFIFIFLAGISKNAKSLTRTFESLLATVSEVTEFIPADLILNTLMQQVLLDNMLKNAPNPAGGQLQPVEDVNSVLKMLIPFLTSSIHSVQFASHSMLVKLMPLLPTLLKEEIKSENEDDDDRIPIKLYSLIDLLKTNNQIVESMLLDVEIGDCCSVVPYTDSYVYSMAYLLLWIEVFEFFSTSPSQIRTGYAAHLEEDNLLSSLFSNVFRLMPENPVQCFKKHDGIDTPKKEGCRAVFMNPPLLSSLDYPSSKKLQSVACYVYCTALRKVSASVRTWWSNLDKRSAEIVNRFTSKYISGMLSAEEIQSVCDSEVQFNNMIVRARPTCREVVATYTVDDNAIELFVQLPTNYPLGPITAEKRGKIMIAQQEWRHWLMQLTTVLTIQNRSVLDGLTIWKKNLDKKFEGVEECTICYYILHATTLKLPKLSCHTCGKKFHAACLYKWFHTSNKSTCPLCRNEF